jgi:hypothetical protein
MKGDEFRIILEDINEKFDTMIEGQNLLNEKLDRHIDENRLIKPGRLPVFPRCSGRNFLGGLN